MGRRAIFRTFPYSSVQIRTGSQWYDPADRVRQLDPGPTGLPLEIYCFTRSTQWVEYENAQSDVFDHLLAILPVFGLRVFQEISDIQQKAADVPAFTGGVLPADKSQEK